MANTYQITLEEKENQKRTVSFEFSIHDDVFHLLDKIGDKMNMSPEQTKAFMIGLKLFGEVMIQQRKHPLLKEFAAPFKEFMITLKKS